MSAGVKAGARLASPGPVGLQHLDGHAAELGQGLHHLLSQQPIGQQFDQRPGLREHARTPLGGGQIAVRASLRDQLGRQRHGLGHLALEGLGALFADEGVRVVLSRQEQEADAAQIARMGQCGLERATGSPAPGGISIEAENHRFGETKQLGHMLGRAGRPECGHRIGVAPLRQRHHVHIPLDHQGIALGAQSLAGFEQSVEFLPLVKDRGFGRVQVLGLADIEYSAAKAYDLTAHRTDRKHDAIAEAVVAFLLLAFVAADDHQPAVAEQRVVVARKHPCQGAPAIGRVAHAEASGHRACQAAIFQVSHCARAGLECATVVLAGLGQHFAEGGALGLLGIGTGAVLGAVLTLGHGQPDLLGQVAHRVHETHAVVLGQKADGIAVYPAAKAVIGLARRADDEAG